MGKAAYPTASDVQSFLEAEGFTVSAGLAAFLDEAALAGRQDFEGRNGADRVMLAEATASTRYYDPPNNGAVVYSDDFINATTPVVGIRPYNGTLETLTVARDYRLEPVQAVAKGLPFDRVRLFRRYLSPVRQGMRSSVEITARHGYGATIPELAWLAMIQRAAWSLWNGLMHTRTGGVQSWTEAGVTEQYNVLLWRQLGDGWDASYQAGVRTYRRYRI